MPVIGLACHELRIRDRKLTWRIIYLIDPDAVVILEVFAKKSRTTPARVIEACRSRLGSYRAARGGK